MSSPFDPSALQAIVFDLDDTLYLQADYKRSGFKAVAQWLEENKGLDADTSYQELEQILQTKGASYPRIFDDFVKQRESPSTLVPALIQLFIAHRPQIQCFPKVRLLLESIKQHFRVGLLTDGRLSVQQKKVHALKLSERFDALLYSDSLGLEKPAESLYCWFEETFMLDGAQIAYIGDNPHKDFIGAKNRNWKTIQIMTGEYAEDQVPPHLCADLKLPSLAELGQLLKLT